MDVFISWAGKRSHAVALMLKEELPKFLNAVKPWVSSTDIKSGARWATEVSGMLDVAQFGILCVTPFSAHSEWLLFEAGALAKKVNQSYVCPLLIGMSPSDVEWPLAQFQADVGNEQGIKRIIQTLNNALDQQKMSDGHIDKMMELLWPTMRDKLAALPPDEDAPQPKRKLEDMVEELLDLVRAMNKPDNTQKPQFALPTYTRTTPWFIGDNGGVLSMVGMLLGPLPSPFKYEGLRIVTEGNFSPLVQAMFELTFSAWNRRYDIVVQSGLTLEDFATNLRAAAKRLSQIDPVQEPMPAYGAG